MYDLGIIGGGPAGYSAALEGARLGLRVVLFEKEEIGGTCLNRGCVPTKFLAHVGQTITRAELAARDGLFFSAPTIDYQKTIARKAEIISTLREGLTQQMLRQKIEIIRGSASIQSKNSISCKSDRFDVRNILIATGSVPAAPLVPGALSSDELLKLEEVPKSLHILGGGVIAVEFANIFRALGAEVTLSIRGDRILRKWDKEIALGLTQSMKRQGIRIQTKCNFDKLQIPKDRSILSAAGRKPNLEGIDTSLVEIGPHGGILTDDNGQTRTEGIFAAGDVLEDSPQLAHVSIEQGKRIARTIAGVPSAAPAAVVHSIVAGQEAASVGLTEESAKEKGIPVAAAKQPMYSNARTMISTTERGFIKLVANRQTKRVIGAQLICQRAGDIVAELALAINQGLTPGELAASTRPHPSFCEAVTDAAELLAEKLR